MTENKHRVCPLSKAKSLDNIFRRLLHNPKRILRPQIKPGMIVLDFGCGPGMFSRAMAELVGPRGRVVAADLQAGMLEILRRKVMGKAIQKRIILHECSEDSIGVDEKFDFILAFYVVHEVPSQQKLFEEFNSLLKPGGKVLVVEPKNHVSNSEFQETINIARQTGLKSVGKKKIFFSRGCILKKIKKI